MVRGCHKDALIVKGVTSVRLSSLRFYFVHMIDNADA